MVLRAPPGHSSELVSHVEGDGGLEASAESDFIHGWMKFLAGPLQFPSCDSCKIKFALRSVPS